MVSFIIPTLNAERYLERCLRSIRKQNYPLNEYEILVVDGGSTDKTLAIAEKYNAKIINNPFIDQESGKSLGIQKSKGKVLVLMDSDNEIVRKDWLRKMLKPLITNPNLFGVESLYYSRKGDNIFNKYCMLLHIADPFSRALASKLITNKRNGYLECSISGKSIYPLGANGFLWRKKVIEQIGLYKPKFEESNFTHYILEKGYRRFARVPGYGIYHYHIDSLRDFIKKRLKIGSKFLNRRKEKKKTWLEGVSRIKFAYAVIYCISFAGPFAEALINYVKTKEKAWFLHPIMSFISVVTYIWVYIKRKLTI